MSSINTHHTVQGMGLAIAAAYLYSLCVLLILFGSVHLSPFPFVLVAAFLVLLPFPVLGIALLGALAGVVVGNCASIRPPSQAWVEGAVIGGLFGLGAALLMAVYLNFVWARIGSGSFVPLLWPVVPYCAAWGACVEAWWARENTQK